MPIYQQFNLPDAGEGLTEAEIVAWHVAVGDTVEVNQTIVEIETAKSLVDLPSPFTGVVTRILVDPGTTVDVGTPIIEVDTDPHGAAPAPTPAPAAVEADGEAREAVLVGYGVSGQGSARRARVARTAPAPA
ncbi:biotin/lipoyl-containing protein, partial [Cellulomonas cellasea]|uniref:biotin/lipoyl-containing protein n=1 Tax=Cellulomonas cellasea TaxID=43670 RepID=UPI0025A31FA4